LHRRVPDFFIVGHAKCGTTALYKMLRRHPEIYMPDLKEPHFFARDVRPLIQPEALPPAYDEYLSLFDAAGPEQRVGEASPSYLRSRTAASAIADVQPAARSIAILREPASFLRSLHLDRVRARDEPERDLRKAIALDEVRRQGQGVARDREWTPAPIYSDRVRYVEQLRRYHAVFPPEQVLVVIYEDFRAHNEATVRSVLRFLEVDDSLPIEVMDANPTIGVRSVRLDELVHAARAGRTPGSRIVKAIVKALTSRQVRSRVLYPIRRRVVYGNPPPPDKNLMLELRRRFKPEVVALSEYLERDLVTLWGYDRIG
jgi:sulfotransferase family protein